MTRKFNNVQEEQCWTPILWDKKTYDLSHLHSQQIEYTHSKNGKPNITYKFVVTYSFHCFAKEDSSTTPNTPIVHARKDSRPFNLERYELSKRLPAIIANLGQNNIPCFLAGYDRYLSIRFQSDTGDSFDYHVVFRTFREKRKLRLHVESAYPEKLVSAGKRKKVGFFAIAYSTLHGKKIKG